MRQHERPVEELNIELQYERSITSSGAVLTLPVATADLKDWTTDGRKFVSKQYDDWMQVIGDFHASVAGTGPKLASLVASITTQIESLLPGLISPSNPQRVALPIASFLQKLLPRSVSDRIAQPIGLILQKLVAPSAVTEVTRHYTINAAVRADILRHLEQLDTELGTEAAIIEAWSDLLSSVEKVQRSVEQVSFRRDTLYAIAQRRNLDLARDFGVFADVRRVLTDVADAVQEELDKAAGVDHEPSYPPTQEPSGVPTWRRCSSASRF